MRFRHAQWILLLALTPVFAIDYNSSDVQTAFQRHDLRQLETLASQGDKALRLEAVEGLVRLRDPQVIRFLASLLNDPDPDIVQSVLWGLPGFGADAGSPDVIAQVETTQQSTSVDVRRTAVAVLEDLRDPDNLKQMHIALVTLGHEQHKEALGFYIQRKDLSILMEARDMLNDHDPFLKQTGMILIHGLDDRDRLGAITQLLQDPSPSVRVAAALVIGDWKETAAFADLAPLLKDPDPMVRLAAVKAIGKHQDPEISIALGSLAKDSAPTVRMALAKAFGQYAFPAGVQSLLQMLHDKDGEVRLNAVQSLLIVPGAEARGHLVYLLEDPRRDIRLVLLKNLDNLMKLPKVNKNVARRSVTKLTLDKDLEVQALAKKSLILVK